MPPARTVPPPRVLPTLSAPPCRAGAGRLRSTPHLTCAIVVLFAGATGAVAGGHAGPGARAGNCGGAFPGAGEAARPPPEQHLGGGGARRGGRRLGRGREQHERGGGGGGEQGGHEPQLERGARREHRGGLEQSRAGGGAPLPARGSETGRGAWRRTGGPRGTAAWRRPRGSCG